MNEAIDALAQHIEDLGVATLGTDLFQENLPDAPDDTYATAMAIYDTGGAPPGLTQNDDTQSPGFQLRSRSLDADTALTKLLSVYQALHGVTETTINGVHFKLIWYLQTNPVSLGRDQRQRFEFTQNFRALVRGIAR